MRPISLWGGIVGGPLISLVYLEISYALVPSACIAGNKHVLALITLAALLAASLTMAVAWRVWHAAGATYDSASGGPLSRGRFMALSGLGLSALSILFVIASAIAIMVLGACD
jgi:hypothetical protein